jgi:hypothetical protein
MSIDPITGYIYIVFYDRRNFPINSTHTELYMATSKDGGETFINEKINDSFFVSNNNIFAGDYINITAYNGHVHAIWTEEDSAKKTTRVVTRGFYYPVDTIHLVSNCNGIHFSNVYPNPSYDGYFYLAYCLEQDKEIEIAVYSIDGKKMGTTTQKMNLNKGNQLLHFSASDFNLQSGIYLVQFLGKGIAETKKLTIINTN